MAQATCLLETRMWRCGSWRLEGNATKNTHSTLNRNGLLTLWHLISFHSTHSHDSTRRRQGFKPTSGRIDRIRFQSSPTVWGYFSVGANGAVHEFADSQFGHLFASGATREDARKALILALKELLVRGEIRTAVPELSQVSTTARLALPAPPTGTSWRTYTYTDWLWWNDSSTSHCYLVTHPDTSAHNRMQ